MSNSRTKTESVKKFTEILLKWLQYIFNTGAVLALVLISAVVIYQILARVLPIRSPSWTEELCRYLFIYCVVFGSGAVLIKGRHINLEIFHEKLPERVRLIYDVVCHLIIAGFSIILIQYAWEFTANADRQTLPTLTAVKKSWVNVSTVIFFVLVPFTCFLLSVRDLMIFIEKGKE